MSNHIETLVVRVEGAMADDRLEGRTDNRMLKAVLWEIDAEAWERGVMWKGGIGTLPPERTPNPYLEPPLVLPTEPTWGLAFHPKFGWDVGRWYLDAAEDLCDAETGGSYRAHNVLAFIEFTPEQVARIEAAR